MGVYGSDILQITYFITYNQSSEKLINSFGVEIVHWCFIKVVGFYIKLSNRDRGK